jgi:hypothetical protein
MLNQDLVRELCLHYAEAWTAGDVAAAASLFSPSAVVRDPIDGPVLNGIGDIRAFFDSVTSVVESLEVVDPLFISADCRHVAARYDIVACVDGRRFVTHAVDIFHLGDDGLVVGMEAIHAPGDVVEGGTGTT